ncbi:hypothetical protein GCM10022251_73700 [Phytohabitans flavus]|uniref:Uncharacterized protein n=1 Tax=Phytohabitans flavus TaxID=1076124 RepID=A0A6F8XKV4_9ACTN|nr:hypothetical protein Pflav_008550 [Phytohabitans flavus]
MAPPSRPGQHTRLYAILALAGFSVFAGIFGPLRGALGLSTPLWVAALLGYASVASIAVALVLLKTLWRPPAVGDKPGEPGAR